MPFEELYIILTHGSPSIVDTMNTLICPISVNYYLKLHVYIDVDT